MSPDLWRRINLGVALGAMAFILALLLLSGCGSRYQPPGEDLWRTIR